MILLRQMIVLFLIMLIGYGLAKRKILDTATNSKISWIVVNVANPAMILSGGLDNDAISPEKLLKTAGIAAGMYLILILLGMVLPRILGVCQEQRNIYSVLTIFGNIGFMGFPILSSMYGKEALLYGSIFIIFFNLLIYTYGIHVIQGAKAGKKEGALHTLRSILNPGVLACMVAMLAQQYQGDTGTASRGVVLTTILSVVTMPLVFWLVGL